MHYTVNCDHQINYYVMLYWNTFFSFSFYFSRKNVKVSNNLLNLQNCFVLFHFVHYLAAPVYFILPPQLACSHLHLSRLHIVRPYSSSIVELYPLCISYLSPILYSSMLLLVQFLFSILKYLAYSSTIVPLCCIVLYYWHLSRQLFCYCYYWNHQPTTCFI